MASAPRYTYLISKALDPPFAIFIGLGAAYTRINREEKEKGRSREETLNSLRRRVDIAMGREVAPAAAPVG